MSASSKYIRALKRLLSVTSSPRLGLSRMERLLAGVGDPHKGVQHLHVAGTNGKGSTLAHAESILRAHKIKTGRTTSPHLTCARERICIAGRPISESAFIAFEEQVFRAAQKMPDDLPTFFERITAMAFLAMKDEKVDVGLIETGLGGRLDATHVIDSIACGITQIGRDHVQWLGEDVQGIAREKIDIANRSKHAFTVPGNAFVQRTFDKACAGFSVPLSVVKPYEGALSMPGDHQRENAALALCLVRAFMKESGRQFSLSKAKAALAKATWPGRSEVFDVAHARFFLDGAHNKNALLALKERYKKRPPAVIIAGFTSGHDTQEMANILRSFNAAHIICTQSKAPRSLLARDIAAAFGRDVFVEANAQRALELALGAGLAGEILVTGSLYLVGEARACFVQMPVDPALPLF